MAVDKINNWRARAAAWLYYQFRAKPNFVALVENVIGRQLQELEDVFQDVLSARILDNASGSALDLWGSVFNEPRSGRSDTAYRVALLLAVARDNGSGTPEDMIAILLTLTDSTRVYLEDEYVTRAVSIYLESPTISTELAAELRTLADSLAPAGVRIVTVSERASSDYFGWNGDPNSGGWGTVEDVSTGGSWTKIV